jgi:hypothetical protein
MEKHEVPSAWLHRWLHFFVDREDLQKTVLASLDMIITPDGELVALTGIECVWYPVRLRQTVQVRFFSIQAVGFIPNCFKL